VPELILKLGFGLDVRCDRVVILSHHESLKLTAKPSIQLLLGFRDEVQLTRRLHDGALKDCLALHASSVGTGFLLRSFHMISTTAPRIIYRPGQLFHPGLGQLSESELGG
jgi:hypothetical protein